MDARKLESRLAELESGVEPGLLVRLKSGEVREYGAEAVRQALRDAMRGIDSPALVAWSEAAAINDNDSGLIGTVNMAMVLYAASKQYGSRAAKEAEDAQTES